MVDTLGEIIDDCCAGALGEIIDTDWCFDDGWYAGGDYRRLLGWYTIGRFVDAPGGMCRQLHACRVWCGEVD